MDPIDPKYRSVLNSIAQVIDKGFNGDIKPKKIGFALILFEFDKVESGKMNWISNANRNDMIDALMEMVVQLGRKSN